MLTVLSPVRAPSASRVSLFHLDVLRDQILILAAPNTFEQRVLQVIPNKALSRA